MENKIFTFLQKNYGWIVALLTGIGVIMSFVLRFIKYIYSMLYFDYYGISYGFFDIEELGLLYDFSLSILMVLCFYSLFYCYKQFYDLFKNKIKFNTKILNVFLILVSNFFIALSSGIKNIGWQLLINMILLIVVEVVVTIIISIFIKNDKEKVDKTDKNDLLNTLKIMPFYLMLLVIIFSGNYLYSLYNAKSYKIINNDKVIVYTTKDYYLILDCEIEDNKLTIYKGNQTKINNENVESKLINFDEIKIK